jgi:serine phosphatase RsbU (regulator of sigma subunit)/anti-sigma regulatory factor (Ser/Thr protein kinase)
MTSQNQGPSISAITPREPAAAGAARGDYRTALRIDAACNFSAVRAASLRVREWLAEKGLAETELDAWELALVEAANNAVKYAAPEARRLPVTIEISCGERDVEARITDHTPGFNWPEAVELPATETERGRGLFLIRSLTDHAAYLRHAGENVMVFRRARPAPGREIFPEAEQLQRRLAETEATLMQMTAELGTSYESLVALFRYSAELGTHTDLKEFARRLLSDLLLITEADCAVLRLLAPDAKSLETLWMLPEQDRTPPAALLLAVETAPAEIRAVRHRQDIWFGPEEPLAADDPLRAAMPVGHGVCHAFFVADQLVGTAALGRRAADRPFTAAQVNLLHAFIDFFAIQIVNARLLDERTAARVTRRELDIAAEMQRSLLPAQLPACPPFTLSAACQSALEIGGDFYDAIPGGDGAVLLVIADVMGKGVPAALFAAVLRNTIRSMPQLFARPAELLGAVNRTLFPDLSRVDMFATAKLAYLDPRRGEILSASAGHCRLMLWPDDGAAANTPGRTGYPLGVDANTVYSQTLTVLPPGAAALLFTDGVSESRNAAGEMLGEKKLRQWLAETAVHSRDAEAGKQFLLERLVEHRGNVPLTDDQTFILIRRQT